MKTVNFVKVIKKNMLFYGFMTALLFICVIGFITYRNFDRLYKTDIEENNSYGNLIKVEELFSYLKDAETARRGYILTGEEHFLVVYSDSLPLIERLKNEVQYAFLNRLDQQPKLILLLESLISKKLDVLKNSINLMENEGYNAQQQSDFTNQGKETMDEIRKIMNEIIENEKLILDKWTKENQINKQHTASVIIIGYCISSALFFFVFYLFNRQISLRKKVEDKLKDSLRVKSEFTSMVSHELRTPLTAIKEGIGIVLDGSAGQINADQKDFLDTAKRNVDRLARLINDVLDFQKLESGKMQFNLQENDFNEVVKESFLSMKPLADSKNIQIELNLAKDLRKVNFDKDKINQAIDNLINNAIKYTDKGSIKIDTRLGNNIVEFSVKDTGVGIKNENIPRLFQSFQQLGEYHERRVASSGLGLSISKEIIERHRGKIWAESEFGKGTVFHFILPIKERRV